MSLGNEQPSRSEQRNEEASMSIKETRKSNGRKSVDRCQDAISVALENARQYRVDATEGDVTVKVLPLDSEVQDIVHILKLLWLPTYKTGMERIVEIQKEIKLLRQLEALNIVIEGSWMWYCIPSDVKRIINKSSSLPKLTLPEWPWEVERNHVKFARAAAKIMFKAGFWEGDIWYVLQCWSSRCANSSELKLNDIDNVVEDMRPWAKYWRVYAGYTLDDLKELTVFNRMFL